MIAFGCVVIIAAVLFLILKPDHDSGPDSNSSNPTSTPTGATGNTNAATPAADPKPPKPQVPTVAFENGEPDGGILKIDVDQGSTVTFKVTSDQPEEVHVHGYDLSSEVALGQPAQFRFDADLPGVYEVEMEQSGIPIAELEVTP